jgi:hypothetical protein
LNKQEENKMDKKEEQKLGLYVFLGFAFGGILGLVLGTLIDNIFNGFWVGALIGVAAGWFASAVAMQRSKEKKEGK